MRSENTRIPARGVIFDLRKAFSLKGMSISDFAEVHGHRIDTVHKVIMRYWGTERVPRGPISKRILQDLQRAVALEEDEHEQEVSHS